jgi:hypothetical protein
LRCQKHAPGPYASSQGQEVFESNDFSLLTFYVQVNNLHSMFLHGSGSRPFPHRIAGSNLFPRSLAPLNYYSVLILFLSLPFFTLIAKGLSFRSDSDTIEDVNLTTLEGSNTNVSLVGLLGWHGGGDAE